MLGAVVLALLVAVALLRDGRGAADLPPIASPMSPTTTPAPSTTAVSPTSSVAVPTPTSSSGPQPIGYQLPSICTYVGPSQVRDATTYWLVRCPSGLLTSALAPSLAAQGWESCGFASGTAYHRKAQLVILVTNFVNRSDATGELGQRSSGAGCGPP